MLRADGRRLLDDAGRAVLLRGVNAGGRSKFPPFLPFWFRDEDDFQPALDAYMDRLASWGINLVRLPFSWEALEPARGWIDETWLARYVAMVDAAWARGLYVLCDFHQDVYASPFAGDGFPLWTLGPIHHGPPRWDRPDPLWFLQYLDPAGPVAAAFDRLWDNADGLFDDFVWMWRLVARRLGGHPGVIGFELINEPGWGRRDLGEFERRTLPEALARLGRAIQAEAPGKLLFAGGCGPDALIGETHLGDPGLDGFVFAPHYYDGGVLVGGRFGDGKKLRRDLQRLFAHGAAQGRPVLFGEVGGSNRSPDLRPYLRAMYDQLDALGAHAAQWEVSFSAEDWNNEDFSLANPDGSERAGVDELVRPYPRAVSGTVEGFAWDARRRTFFVEVAGAGRAASEIFLPTRHLGPNPRIQLRGARHAWDPRRGLLQVEATDDRWRLDVAR